MLCFYSSLLILYFILCPYCYLLGVLNLLMMIIIINGKNLTV